MIKHWHLRQLRRLEGTARGGLIVGCLPDREERIVGLVFSQGDDLLNGGTQVVVIEVQEFGEVIGLMEIDQVIQQYGVVESGFIQIEALQTRKRWFKFGVIGLDAGEERNAALENLVLGKAAPIKVSSRACSCKRKPANFISLL